MAKYKIKDVTIDPTEEELKYFSNMDTLKCWLIATALREIENDLRMKVNKQFEDKDFYARINT